MITKHKSLYMLGRKILKSTDIRNNFYNIPPKIYTKYEDRQCYLVNNYIEEINNVNKYWDEHKNYMNLYLLRDYGSNKINFEKK